MAERETTLKGEILANHEQALRDAYELYYQLNKKYIEGIMFEESEDETVIVKMAMIKAKIVIIKKKIRDL